MRRVNPKSSRSPILILLLNMSLSLGATTIGNDTDQITFALGPAWQINGSAVPEVVLSLGVAATLIGVLIVNRGLRKGASR